MEKLFVPYSTAKLLKDKGFDEPCFANYCASHKEELIPYRGYPDNGDEDTSFSTSKNSSKSKLWVTAPLYQQVVDWLRTKGYTLCVIEEYHYEPITFKYQILNLNVPRDDRKYHNKEFFYESSPFDNFKTYYEALEFAIRFTLKILL